MLGNIPQLNFDNATKKLTSLEKLHLVLKENINTKIKPVMKVYGLKSGGKNRFVKEKNGLIISIYFIGYFRGGGFENMITELCPLYDIGNCPLSERFDTYSYKKMTHNWNIIKYDTNDIDEEKISQKFDDILLFFAKDVLPRFNEINSLDMFFANERLNFLKEFYTQNNVYSPLSWDEKEISLHLWCQDDYLFGVLDLLNGKYDTGYERLKHCLDKVNEFEKRYEKDKITFDHNYRRDNMAVMYYNAKLFYETKEYTDINTRKEAIKKVYEEICKFMRYFHYLAKPIKR